MGIVLSDTFDGPIDHEYLGKDLEYPISDYEKKRRVLWIKEIDQDELPESLLWIQTGQRAIFDISKNAKMVMKINHFRPTLPLKEKNSFSNFSF